MSSHLNKILAIINRNFLSKFSNLIQEGSAYFITNFHVADYEFAPFKMLIQKMNINFHKNTGVRRCMDFKMDKVKLFDFTYFEGILDANFDKDIPFD